LIAPAFTAFLYLAVVLRFLLLWPFSSPNPGGTVELGGAALVVALGISERLGRGRSGVQIDKWAGRGGDGRVRKELVGPWLDIPCT